MSNMISSFSNKHVKKTVLFGWRRTFNLPKSVQGFRDVNLRWRRKYSTMLTINQTFRRSVRFWLQKESAVSDESFRLLHSLTHFQRAGCWRFLHFNWSFAVLLIELRHMILLKLFVYCSTPCCFCGLLRFPSGVQCTACLVIAATFFLDTCSIHIQLAAKNCHFASANA